MFNLYVPYKISELTENRIEEIHKLLESNPHMTLKEIGDTLGVTRERVRQIILVNNYKFEHPNSLYRNHRNIKRIIRLGKLPKIRECSGCTTAISTQNKGGMCRPCRKESNLIKLICTYCGNKATLSSQASAMRRSHIKRNKIKNPDLEFCSLDCSSKYVGRRFGTGSNRRTSKDWNKL